MFQTLLSVLGSWLCRTSIAHLSALLLHAPGSGEVHDRRWPGSALDHIGTVLANCAKCLLVNDEMFLDTALPDSYYLLHLWGEREASSKSAKAEGRSETLDLALHHKSFTSLSPHQNTSLRSHPTSLHSHGDRVSNCLGGRAPAVGLFSSSAQAFSTMVH